VRFISWNVNGIRSALDKGLREFIENEPFDALCLQEVRAERDEVILHLPGMHIFWNSAEKKGYSGTATFSRIDPLREIYGMKKLEHDSEGRITTLEFEDFFLVNVYTPNAGQTLERLPYRCERWDPAFLAFLKKLERLKPVVVCGDLNVAHREIDLARPKENVGNAGFTPEEREGFDNLVAAGFVDTFREFCSEGGFYSWWSFRGGARERNVGWRIDYFLISSVLRPRLEKAEILSQIMGSDHCPVAITLR
jgi:exodeoxyribonuclease-3